jgi:phospholipid/cholesterol/gamma-HCH transport system ATP-binding protein
LKEHTRLDDKVISIVTNMKLEQVGLAGFGGLMPEQLSGGMKKRAGLARSLAMDPEVLFVDEPSAGLDPITAAGLDELLVNLKETFKMTIVVVTHELASVFRISDQVAMIDQGRIIFSGTLEELKSCDHPRVQQFLNRKPDEMEYDPEEHLRWLTAGV